MEWGPAITGAFCALAVAIVLGLFGSAFGAGGLGVLSGIWQVVTPFVATFIGAAVAAAMSERRDAYPSGIMVWCLSLVAGALLIADVGALRMTRGAQGVPANAGPLALAGLAAILGLLGAAVGAGFAVSASRRGLGSTTSRADRVATGDHPAYEEGEPAASSRAPVRDEEHPLAH